MLTVVKWTLNICWIHYRSFEVDQQWLEPRMSFPLVFFLTVEGDNIISLWNELADWISLYECKKVVSAFSSFLGKIHFELFCFVLLFCFDLLFFQRSVTASILDKHQSPNWVLILWIWIWFWKLNFTENVMIFLRLHKIILFIHRQVVFEAESRYLKLSSLCMMINLFILHKYKTKLDKRYRILHQP